MCNVSVKWFIDFLRIIPKFLFLNGMRVIGLLSEKWIIFGCEFEEWFLQLFEQFWPVSTYLVTGEKLHRPFRHWPGLMYVVRVRHRSWSLIWWKKYVNMCMLCFKLNRHRWAIHLSFHEISAYTYEYLSHLTWSTHSLLFRWLSIHFCTPTFLLSRASVTGVCKGWGEDWGSSAIPGK